MLTRIVEDRVYDFSHVVGGRDQVHSPRAIAVDGHGHAFAVVNRPDRGGVTITRYSVGQNAGDEEIVNHIGRRGVDPGEFEWPAGIAVDSDRNLYVADAFIDRVSVFTEDGDFLRMFGSSGTGPAQFTRPSGIAVESDGNVLVVDTLNHRVQRLTPGGEHVAEWGSQGSNQGEFDSPWGITTDSEGCIYVADHKNHRIQKFDPDGSFILQFGSHGDGKDELDHPSDVAVDPDSDIYVCDWANHRVQAFDSEGRFLTSFRGDAQDLSKWQVEYVGSNPDVYKARRRVYTLEPEWRFAMPMAVAFDDANSRLLVADTQRWRIQVYNKLHDYADPQFNI